MKFQLNNRNKIAIVFTVTGEEPTVPNPVTLLPHEVGWVDATDLLDGEVAINADDRKIFWRDGGTIYSKEWDSSNVINDSSISETTTYSSAKISTLISGELVIRVNKFTDRIYTITGMGTNGDSFDITSLGLAPISYVYDSITSTLEDIAAQIDINLGYSCATVDGANLILALSEDEVVNNLVGCASSYTINENLETLEYACDFISSNGGAGSIIVENEIYILNDITFSNIRDIKFLGGTLIFSDSKWKNGYRMLFTMDSTVEFTKIKFDTTTLYGNSNKGTVNKNSKMLHVTVPLAGGGNPKDVQLTLIDCTFVYANLLCNNGGTYYPNIFVTGTSGAVAINMTNCFDYGSYSAVAELEAESTDGLAIQIDGNIYGELKVANFKAGRKYCQKIHIIDTTTSTLSLYSDSSFEYIEEVGAINKIKSYITGTNVPDLTALTSSKCIFPFSYHDKDGSNVNYYKNRIVSFDLIKTAILNGGATGSFTSQDGKTVTVTNGLITSIVP